MCSDKYRWTGPFGSIVNGLDGSSKILMRPLRLNVLGLPIPSVRYKHTTHMLSMSRYDIYKEKTGLLGALTALQLGNPFFFPKLLEVSIGRNFGALEGLKC